MRSLHSSIRHFLNSLTFLIKEVWEDVTEGQLHKNELIYIKTSAVIFLLFIYVWVTL
jgi:hypothetical protein